MANPFINTMRLQPQPEKPLPSGPMDVDVDGEEAKPQSNGVIKIENADGTVTIDFGGAKPKAASKADFNDNLAEELERGELTVLAEELLRMIEEDDKSRDQWLQIMSKGIDLLALKLDEPKGDVGSSAAPVEGMSTVRDPMMLEAVLRFQANARGELLPASGPVKVQTVTGDSQGTDVIAQALERDFNYYLTAVASEYYPDTDRLLFMVAANGCGFKKVYFCPIRQRPVSESVDANDLIVSDSATDLKTCGRYTHRIRMRPSIFRRMQLAGVYRDIVMQPPADIKKNPIDRAIEQTTGIRDNQQSMEDKHRDREIFECRCEIDLPVFEDKQKGKETGLALPYKVSIDKESREILEIRRNWDEADDLKLGKACFVKYPFVKGPGFYDIGLTQILGNLTRAVTALVREGIDAGMFANFPGFLYAKLSGRQLTNEMRVPPGGGRAIETDGLPIQQAIMPLPYKEMGAATLQLITQLREVGQRLGGTAELQVGEGRQDAPVGTTLALIEQATKVIDAVHKRIHSAQAEEFQILKQVFKDNPLSFFKHIRNCAFKDDTAEKSKFVAALETADIVPAADPNTSSQMQRIMKAQGLKQLQMANQALYDPVAVDTRILQMIGINDIQGLFNPNPPPPQGAPQDPAKMLAAQAAMLKAQTDAKSSAGETQRAQMDDQQRAADRASKEKLAQLELQRDLVVHQDKTQLEHQSMLLDHRSEMAGHQNEAQQTHADLHSDMVGHANTAMQAHQQHMSNMTGHENDANQAEQQAQQAETKAKMDAEAAKTKAKIDMKKASQPPAKPKAT